MRSTFQFFLLLVLGASLVHCASSSAGPSKSPAAPAPKNAESAPPLEPAPLAVERKEEESPALDLAFLSSPERSEDDLALDTQRLPAEMLRFFGIQPKMRVADLAAGFGYTTEILARVVGPGGQVFGQNSPFILKKYAEGAWSERLKKSALANVVRVDSEMDAPLPPEAKELDAVIIVLFYHDTVWFKTDRAAMNKAIFDSLRSGGVYGIIDHSARSGDGVEYAKILHRIEEDVVREEVVAAGFELPESADFLRNSEDPRDWNASPSNAGDRRGKSDRFVLRFVKP